MGSREWRRLLAVCGPFAGRLLGFLIKWTAICSNFACRGVPCCCRIAANVRKRAAGDATRVLPFGPPGDVPGGVWVGYAETKSLGSGETGAVAALPSWRDVARAYLVRRPDRT